MDKTKKYLNLIIEILLVFSIMLAMLSIFIKYVVLDKNTYLNMLDKNNTYEQIKDSAYKKIDDMLSAKNINIDIKESILTEDDIKREVDNALSGIIDYLKTGENNIKPIDTELYKQRVADTLHSIIGNVINPTNNDLSFNNNLHIQNTTVIENESQLNEMTVVKEKSQVGQDMLKVEKLMTRDEAEAKVRELLKQKGLTEEQAIEKAKQKGITEEQALKILAGYGITIDDQPTDNESTSGNLSNNKTQLDNNSDSSVQNSENATESYGKEASSNNQAEGTTSKIPADNSIKSKLDSIENKLLDEAGSSIEKEVEKVNFNKVLESSKFQKLAKITSIIYRMFWLFMILPIILIVILIKMNVNNLNLGLKQIRNAFLLTGLISSAAFFGAYLFKAYEKININPIYFNEVISYAIRHFLIVLSSYGSITLVIGLCMFIPTSKKFNK